MFKFNTDAEGRKGCNEYAIIDTIQAGNIPECILKRYNSRAVKSIC